MTMPNELHVHVHVDNGFIVPVIQQLDRIEARLQQVQTFEGEQMADLSQIQQEVAENNDVTQSAVVLLGSLAQMIRDNATDQGALNDLANSLDSQSRQLADAVVANTPVSPAPGTGGGGGETPPAEPV